MKTNTAAKQLRELAAMIIQGSRENLAQIADLDCWLMDADGNVHERVREIVEGAAGDRDDARDIERLAALAGRGHVHAMVRHFEDLDTLVRDAIWDAAPAFVKLYESTPGAFWRTNDTGALPLNTHVPHTAARRTARSS